MRNHQGWIYGLLLTALALLALSLQAAPSFPNLTGRVVDEAGLLSAGEKRQLRTLLEAHERKTGNQVVVVTVKSLQGYAIEDYGYQLGRHWGIGQKERNNGVLLIVAPKERKVRIEVGYGLEGVLTDAQASNIIQSIMLPAFRLDDMSGGIVAGTSAIVSLLEGTVVPVQESRSSGRSKQENSTDIGGIFLSLFFIFFILGEFISNWLPSRLVSSGVIGTLAFLVGMLLLQSVGASLFVALLIVLFHFFTGGGGGPRGNSGHRGYRGYGGGYYSGGGGVSGGGFGGFSGGGGSFGGGGASGGW